MKSALGRAFRCRVVVLLALLSAWPVAASASEFGEMLARGQSLVDAGDLAAAAELLEAALSELDESPDAAPRGGLAALCNELAHVHKALGHGPRAEEFYRRAIDQTRVELGELHPNVAFGLANLGALYMEQQRRSLAEATYRRALDIAAGSLGPTHPETLAILEELASLFVLESRDAAAASIYRDLLAAAEVIHGRDDLELLPVLESLAGVEARRGDDIEAAAIYARIVRIRETLAVAEPDLAVDLAVSLGHIALVESRLGRAADAEAHALRALEIFASRAPEHPDHVAVLNNLATLYIDGDRPLDAVALLERALDLRSARALDDDIDLVPVLANLASLYDRLERYREALAISARALRIVGPQIEHLEARPRNQLGPHESLWLDVLLLHRENLARLGGGESADPALRKDGPSGDQEYWVQIGSRSTEEEARRDQERLERAYPRLLLGLPHRLDEVELGERGVWYRMQYGPFGRPEIARRLCEQLAASGDAECLVFKESPVKEP